MPARGGGVTAARAAFDIRSVPLATAAYDENSAKLVRALVDARILLSSGEGKEATVRLAHARVLDSWQRAKAIVTENADFYRVRADVEEQRRKWEAAKRSRDLLIGRGRPLAEAESIVRRFPEEIPVATRDFIKRSGRRARLAQTRDGGGGGAVRSRCRRRRLRGAAGHPRPEGSRRPAPASRRVARRRVTGRDSGARGALFCGIAARRQRGRYPFVGASSLVVLSAQTKSLRAASVTEFLVSPNRRRHRQESRCSLPAFADHEQRPLCDVRRCERRR